MADNEIDAASSVLPLKLPLPKGRPKKLTSHESEEESDNTTITINKTNVTASRWKMLQKFAENDEEPKEGGTQSIQIRLETLDRKMMMDGMSDDMVCELVHQRDQVMEIEFDCAITKESQRPGAQKRTAGVLTICNGVGEVVHCKEMVQTEGKLFRIDALKNYVTPYYYKWKKLSAQEQEHTKFVFAHDDACSLLFTAQNNCVDEVDRWMCNQKWVVDVFHYSTGQNGGGHIGLFCVANCSHFTTSNNNKTSLEGCLENACEHAFAGRHRCSSVVRSMSEAKFCWALYDWWQHWNRKKAANTAWN